MRSTALGGQRRLAANTTSITALTSTGYSFSGASALAKKASAASNAAPAAATHQNACRAVAARSNASPTSNSASQRGSKRPSAAYTSSG